MCFPMKDQGIPTFTVSIHPHCNLLRQAQLLAHFTHKEAEALT